MNPVAWFDRGKNNSKSEQRDAQASGSAVKRDFDLDESATEGSRGVLDGRSGATCPGTRKGSIRPSLAGVGIRSPIFAGI
jgi:hypothetical protein